MTSGQTATLIYLHGFNSSPQAAKAQMVLRHLQKNSFFGHFVVPWIPPQPQPAADYLRQLLQELGPQPVGLIGSSLGGFYAAYLTQTLGLPSVLINPVVHPGELIKQHLGENQNPYSGENYNLNTQHIDEFRELEVKQPNEPGKILLLAQKGDETLDYRQAMKQYKNCEQIIEEGGNHHFQGFEHHLPRILDFFELNNVGSQQSPERKIV